MDASGQTTSKVGTQTHPSADGLSKVLISSQTPQNILTVMGLPTKRIKPRCTHKVQTTVLPTRRVTEATTITLLTRGRHQKQGEL